MDLIAFVQLVSSEATVKERHLSDAAVGWVLVELRGGKRLLLAERSYRSGTKLIVDPSAEELEAARRDSWAAWNNERGELVDGIDLGAERAGLFD